MDKKGFTCQCGKNFYSQKRFLNHVLSHVLPLVRFVAYMENDELIVCPAFEYIFGGSIN